MISDTLVGTCFSVPQRKQEWQCSKCGCINSFFGVPAGLPRWLLVVSLASCFSFIPGLCCTWHSLRTATLMCYFLISMIWPRTVITPPGSVVFDLIAFICGLQLLSRFPAPRSWQFDLSRTTSGDKSVSFLQLLSKSWLMLQAEVTFSS